MRVIDFLKLLKENDVSGIGQYLQNHKANKEVNGQSLLYWAVFHNRVSIVRKLIEQDAEINYKDNLGRTPLSTACFFDFVEISSLLLEKGAKVDATCVERAYHGWDGHIQIETLNLLQENGVGNLYLDDLRDIPKGFIGARTVEEAISVIMNTYIHIFSLDHDLGMDNSGNLRKTGYDLVKYICEKGIRPANRVYIHTDNVVGRENMYQTLKAAQRRGFIDGDIEIYHYPFIANSYSGEED
ncbi:cyclic-phosphate processing receiver domain-containing protein [Bacillus sp. PS06]|uniref:cyclic-phosphate processing receiver domain-containing protein n=1 Tax=Bacillus sp. PS06 TaxID=2764176 RepID=UPI00177E9FAD|nr:ankyrin repeat domain-containing protein [Bacillus sp. PS06]MBD8069770.1 ankyrin repeat domain-containing protein [Bacillus sp. PS06]